MRNKAFPVQCTYVTRDCQYDDAFVGHLYDKIKYSVIDTTDQYSAIELSSLTAILDSAAYMTIFAIN